MFWQHPPIIKIYEALGAVADGRVHLDGDTAKVYSSSGNKYYDVQYDAESGAIMTNDNGSYWKGYLGYPAIAYLLAVGALDYRADLAALLKGVKWKDLNQKHKNDFEKTLAEIESGLESEESERLAAYVQELSAVIEKLKLKHLGQKKLPPEGY